MKLAKDFDKLASDRTTSPNEKIYYKNTAKYFMDNMPDKAFNDMMGGAPEHIGGTIGRRTSAIIGKDKAKKVTGYREELKKKIVQSVMMTHVNVRTYKNQDIQMLHL